jgi:hypothetical protein
VSCGRIVTYYSKASYIVHAHTSRAALVSHSSPQITTVSNQDGLSAILDRRAMQNHTDQPAEALQSWFSHNGGWLNPHVRVVFDDTGANGFHVIAATALSSPAVARCPIRLTLSFLCLDDKQDVVAHVDSPLQKCLGKVPDFVLNYLFLMEQRCSGKRSTWHPYIACLPEPETMNTPIWFTDEDMEYLKGTNLLQASKDRQQGLSEQWAHAQSVMNQVGVTMPSQFN